MLMLLDPRPHWAPLCRMLELGELIDDPRFVDNDARMKNGALLIDIIQEKIGTHDWAHWQPIFQQWDAPWELIQSIHEVAADPQVHANEMVFPVAIEGKQITMVAGPVAFDTKTVTVAATGSPQLGAHTEALLAEVGYTKAQISELREQGVVQ